jgi:hypothetical protein
VLPFAATPELGSNAPKASVDVAELNRHVPTTFAVTVTVLMSAANAILPKPRTNPKTIARPANFFISFVLLFLSLKTVCVFLSN